MTTSAEVLSTADSTQTAGDCLAAANKGDLDAQMRYGLRCKDGDGIDRNLSEAMNWLRLAASRGHGRAQYVVGRMYALGDEVPRNDTEAQTHLVRCCEPEHHQIACSRRDIIDAHFLLGELYSKAHGLHKDPERAIWCYSIAAMQSHAEAQLRLGAAYATGDGAERNLVDAYAWISIAAANGSDEARKALEGIAAKMNVDRIREAQDKARLWVESNFARCDAESVLRARISWHPHPRHD